MSRSHIVHLPSVHVREWVRREGRSAQGNELTALDAAQRELG